MGKKIVFYEIYVSFYKLFNTANKLNSTHITHTHELLVSKKMDKMMTVRMKRVKKPIKQIHQS